MAAALAALLAAALAPPAVGQGAGTHAGNDLPPGSTAAPTPWRAFDLAEQAALARLDDYDAQWRAVLAAAEPALALAAESRPYLERALDRAARAVELRPDGVDGRYAVAVSAGLLAEVEGGRRKVQLAETAFRESRWVLETDPLHAGAHHIQGRVQAAVMRLSRFNRSVLLRLIGGGAMAGASWEGAVSHLRAAAEQAPEEGVYHLELGLALQDSGQQGAGIPVLERAARLCGARLGQDWCRRRAEARLPES